MRVYVLVRAVGLAALAACGLAVSVARSAPRPASFRLRSEAREAVVSGALLQCDEARTQVLDTATGTLSRLPLPEGETLDGASFSAWVDDDGERQVVGRWARRVGGRNRSFSGTGLGRFSYPSGRALDRVGDVPVPASAPCWYPQAAPRVVYPTFDGGLFEYAFGAARTDGSVAPGKAGRVSWPAPPAALGVPCVHDMVWPADDRLGGRILATVGAARRGDGTKGRGPRRLWWVRLSVDGHRVEEAVPADDRPPGAGPFDYEEALPSVGRAPDGRLFAAYRRAARGGGPLELCVAPIELDARNGAPRIRLALARRVADVTVAVPATFARDGRSLFVLEGAVPLCSRLRRYAAPTAAAHGALVLANDVPAR